MAALPRSVAARSSRRARLSGCGDRERCPSGRDIVQRRDGRSAAPFRLAIPSRSPMVPCVEGPRQARRHRGARRPNERRGPSDARARSVAADGSEDRGPRTTSSPRPVYQFVASDRRTPRSRLRYRCSFDSRRLHECAARYSQRLAVGRHVLRAQAVDRAGNRSRVTSVTVVVKEPAARARTIRSARQAHMEHRPAVVRRCPERQRHDGQRLRRQSLAVAAEGSRLPAHDGDLAASGRTWRSTSARPPPTRRPSTKQATLWTDFSSAARAPAANRYLIWRVDPAYSGRARIINPDGASGNKIGRHHRLERAQQLPDLLRARSRRGAGAQGERERAARWASTSPAPPPTRTRTSRSWTRRSTASASAPSLGKATRPRACSPTTAPRSCSSIRSRSTTSEAIDDFRRHPSARPLHPVPRRSRSRTRSSATTRTATACSSTTGGAATIPAPGDRQFDLEQQLRLGHSRPRRRGRRDVQEPDHHRPHGRGNSSWGIEFYPAPTGAHRAACSTTSSTTTTTRNRSPTPAGWTISNEQTADPRYANAAAGDLHLLAGSPALGYTDTVFSPAVDYDGAPRPAGAEDAGAYER